jgi:aminopeptidase
MKAMKQYPPFDLRRLLQTVFDPKEGEKLSILIDLENPGDVADFAFLKNEKFPVQKKAHDVFYQGLKKGVMKDLKLGACDFYAYKMTGGSNLELPATVTDPQGKTHPLEEIYKKYNLILCIGNYSATAPLTAAAKKYGFRGGTMHGMNETILKSGLAVDYNDVSRETEKLRQGMTHADYVDVEFQVDKKIYHLHIDLKKQEAQKSHGMCREAPDVANLPAGEVYFVPREAKGEFPIKFEEDGTIGLMHVDNCKVNQISLIKGSQKTVDKYIAKFEEDPAAGILGELGFGTQPYPYAGADIQDEKIFGTFHIATGRNDHLTGDVTIDKFHHLRNASHDDILFSSTKTPEIKVNEVKMHRFGKDITLIRNYEPTSYLLDLVK